MILGQNTLRAVFVALFAAIIGVSGFIAIPIGPVPVVLQNMMIFLAAAVLGGIQGAAAVGLYIIAGLIGLPVFAGGRSGIAVLASPTGGFIAGYFAGSLGGGLFAGRPSVAEQKTTLPQALRVAAAILICAAVIYIFGIAHMVRTMNLSVPAALAAGFFPFIPVDCVKIAVAIPLAVKLRPLLARYMYPDEDGKSGDA